MAFSQRFIRSVIETIWEQAPIGGSTFLDALKACRAGNWTKVATGWLVQSSSGAGYHTAFHIPSSPNDPNNVTPSALQEMFQLIIEKYRVVKNDWGINEDNDGTFDDSAFGKAISRLFPTIKGSQQDYSYFVP